MAAPANRVALAHTHTHTHRQTAAKQQTNALFTMLNVVNHKVITATPWTTSEKQFHCLYAGVHSYTFKIFAKSKENGINGKSKRGKIHTYAFRYIEICRSCINYELSRKSIKTGLYHIFFLFFFKTLLWGFYFIAI